MGFGRGNKSLTEMTEGELLEAYNEASDKADWTGPNGSIVPRDVLMAQDARNILSKAYQTRTGKLPVWSSLKRYGQLEKLKERQISGSEPQDNDKSSSERSQGSISSVQSYSPVGEPWYQKQIEEKYQNAEEAGRRVSQTRAGNYPILSTESLYAQLNDIDTASKIKGSSSQWAGFIDKKRKIQKELKRRGESPYPPRQNISSASKILVNANRQSQGNVPSQVSPERWNEYQQERMSERGNNNMMPPINSKSENPGFTQPPTGIVGGAVMTKWRNIKTGQTYTAPNAAWVPPSGDWVRVQSSPIQGAPPFRQPQGPLLPPPPQRQPTGEMPPNFPTRPKRPLM